MSESDEIRLDTHVVAWLASGETELLSTVAKELIESRQIVVSPIVVLELTYLHEIGRLSVSGVEVIADLRGRVGLVESEIPLAQVVSSAIPLGFTRDPFDRLIAGDALAAGTPLLSRDRNLLEHVSVATW